MSEQRLIDANFLAECIEGAANRLLSEYGSNLITDTLTEVSNSLKDGRLGITVDAVPREEHESLVRRFKHLLESDYIRSFDEVKPGTGEYKRDIREADALIRQLEEERDAYREAVKNIAGCLECVHFDNDAAEDPPVCKTCKGMSNWQWCGAHKMEVSE